jgi:imidazolonepropionase-like amidohydrolase
MRYKFFVVCLLVLLYPSVGLSQQIPPLVAEQGYADMVLVNGKVVSMDDRSITPNTPGNIAQAMAIKGERIMALGSNAEMRRLAGPNTRFVDVGNRTVIPGLIQTHYHSYGSAARTYGPQLGLVDPSVKLIVVAETTAEATAKKVRDTILNAIRVQQQPGLVENPAAGNLQQPCHPGIHQGLSRLGGEYRFGKRSGVCVERICRCSRQGGPDL